MRKTLGKIFFCLAILSTSVGYSNSGRLYTAQKGVLSLRDWDNTRIKKLPLKGEWEFFHNQLLDRNQLKKIKGIRSYISFNTLWNNAFVKRKPISNTGVATYHMTVLFNGNNQNLGLFVDDIYTSYKILINDVEIGGKGIVGPDKVSSVPQKKPEVYRIPTSSDTLDIIIQVANFHHNKGGASDHILIANYDLLKYQYDRDVSVSYFVFGLLMMCVFFFLSMYIVNQRERSLMFFALFCFTIAYRIIGTEYYPIYYFIPDLSWGWATRLEYLAIYAAASLFALYSTQLYPLERPNPVIMWAFYGISGVLALATLVLSPTIYTWLASMYIFLLTGYMFIAAYVYFKAYLFSRPSSRIAFSGAILILAAIAQKILTHFGVTPRMGIYENFAFMLFILCHSFILIYLFALNYKKAKDDADLASRAKSDFLSTMSHEMRTPLNAIINATNFLEEESPRDDQIEPLNILKIGSENLHSVINDILDYNKIESGKLEVENRDLDIYQLIDNSFKLLRPRARQKDIALDLQIDRSIPEALIGDPIKVNQILINLLGNAIKFTNEGSVTLYLEKVYLDDATVSIKFSVVDTGIGIPKDKQGEIFERFSQASSSTNRKFGGTGLGLSITRRLVELLGGRIYLYSKEHQGSRFYFTLKFKLQDVKKTVNVEEEIDKEKLVGKKVLIVEDNELNVKILQKFLTKWNLEGDLAINGVHAINKVEDNDYDLILMDLQMPVMDGYETTSAIRKKGIRTPIIALTADATSDVVARAHRIGMNDCITKPFNPTKLIRKIYYFIGVSKPLQGTRIIR